jgi:hypothetical protein
MACPAGQGGARRTVSAQVLGPPAGAVGLLRALYTGDRVRLRQPERAGRQETAIASGARPAGLVYAGAYHSGFYGTITVVARSGALHVLMPPKPTDYPLEHWDGNLFAFFPVGENALGISAATFAPGQNNDRAATLTLEYYNNAQYPDGARIGIFTRQ